GRLLRRRVLVRADRPRSTWKVVRVETGECGSLRSSMTRILADVLTRKALAACAAYEVKTLIVVGGVAANSRVRGLAEQRCAAAGVELRVPPMTLCTDNGAMIAAVGDLLVRSGAEPAPLEVSIDPSAPLEYASLTPLPASSARAA
ncbi:hypothetical protein ACFXMP_44875, partial [Streptomyces anulatus]